MSLAVLLPTDTVELFAPAGLDVHGWRLPGGDPEPEAEAAPYWTGPGSLQLAPGPSDPRAAAGGGRGPYDPARALTGNLFLPPGAEPVEGARARIRGRRYVLSAVRLVLDPMAPGNGLSCWQATATTDDTGGSDG